MFGPLIRVELLTSARRWRNYMLRSGYAGVLLLCLWSAYASTTSWTRGDDLSQMSAVGQAFFATFAIVQLLAVMLCAPAYTSGAIALEKDRRTLELLLTSQLSSWEIVISKYASRLAHVVVVLACGVPLLMWGMLFGGFSTQQIIQAFTIAVASALAVGALGLCLSVWAKRTHQALIGTYAVLLLYLVVLPLLLAFIDQIPGWGIDQRWWLQTLHPFFLLGEVIEFRGGRLPPVTWFAVGCAGLSVVLVLVAVWRMRPVYLRQTFGTPKRTQRRRRSLPPVWDNPVAWKEVHTLRSGGLSRVSGVVYILLFLVIGALFGWQHWVENRSFGVSEGLLRMVAPTLVGLSLVLGGLQASAAIVGERDRHTLDILLVTPLDPSQVVWGKFLGVAWRMAWWVILPIGLLAVATRWGWAHPACWFGLRDGMLSPWSILCVIVCSAVYLAFAIALGLTMSLVCRSAARARATTLALMIFLGGAYMLCCFPVMVRGVGNEATAATIVMASPLAVLGFVTFPPDFFVDHGPPASFAVAALLYVIAYAVATYGLLQLAIARFDARLRK